MPVRLWHDAGFICRLGNHADLLHQQKGQYDQKMPEVQKEVGGLIRGTSPFLL